MCLLKEIKVAISDLIPGVLVEIRGCDFTAKNYENVKGFFNPNT
jgi:hypothetical protein